MRVLIINTFVEGTSTAKIAVGLYNKLKTNGHECKILYGAGKESPNSDFIKIATDFDIKLGWLHNQLTGVHGHFSPFAMKQVYKIMEEFQPEIVQLYNLHYHYLDIYGLFKYLKQNKMPTVYGMLDEYPYMGYCCYPYDCIQYQSGCRQCEGKRFRKEYPRNLLWNGAKKTVELKKKAYDKFEQLIFTGPEFVVRRAKNSYLLRDKHIEILDEYVDNEKTFVPREIKSEYKEWGISEEKVILLNVAPSNDPRKGVADFIELARRFENNEKYVFVNVGFQGDIEELPKNYVPISFVRDQEKLAKIYTMADLLVCTSYADTMPNVCLDALSCGTPILGYDISGVPYVAEEPCGYFVKPGDLDSLCEFVAKVEKKDEKEAKEYRRYAIERYSPQAYYEKSMKIYESFGKRKEC